MSITRDLVTLLRHRVQELFFEAVSDSGADPYAPTPLERQLGWLTGAVVQALVEHSRDELSPSGALSTTSAPRGELTHAWCPHCRTRQPLVDGVIADHVTETLGWVSTDDPTVAYRATMHVECLPRVRVIS